MHETSVPRPPHPAAVDVRRSNTPHAIDDLALAGRTPESSRAPPSRVGVSATTQPSIARKARAVVDAFVANDLLTFASAISFQMLSSLVPLLLFAFGMLGFLQLEHVWRDQLAP